MRKSSDQSIRRRSNLPGNLSGTPTATAWTSRESGVDLRVGHPPKGKATGEKSTVVKLSGLRTERGNLARDPGVSRDEH